MIVLHSTQNFIYLKIHQHACGLTRKNNEGSKMYAFNYMVVGGGGGGPLQKIALCLKLWFSLRWHSGRELLHTQIDDETL
jgi:hypothetical protein